MGEDNNATFSMITMRKSVPSIHINNMSNSNVSCDMTGSFNASITNSYYDVTKAEILWALKVVMSNFPTISCDGLSALFKCMLPDSKVAEGFDFAKEKCFYMLSYGIAPHFHSLLKCELKISPYFVISLDASLNEVTESEQINYYITYWDSTRSRVETRYLTSTFLGHARSDDLLIAFLDCTRFLDESKILQVSMDGSWINWSYLKALGRRREEYKLPKLINIGICDLYVVHRAFKAGAEKTGWQYKELLKSLFSVLNSNPAFRCEYTQVTGSSVLPLRFCGAHWIENEAAAQRAIDLWENMHKLVTYWESVENSKQFTSRSFFRLQKAFKDKVVIAKLHFFCFVAMTLKHFINVYETSKPMVPFLHDDLHNIVRKLMSWFVKCTVLHEACTAEKLCTVDLHQEGNYVDMINLNIGFGADHFLQNCVRDNTILKEDITSFKKGCIVFLIALIKEITTHSCLQSSIARNAGSLNPNKMISNSELSKFRFEKLLQKLIELKRLTYVQGHKALNEYNEFIYRAVHLHKDKFLSFSQSEDRLDYFFFTEIGLQDYPVLANIVQMILCLSHGPPPTKGDFDFSNNLPDNNMTEISIISERTIQDHMCAKNLTPETFQVTEQLIMSVKEARQHYQRYLLEKNKKKIIKRTSSLRENTENNCQCDINSANEHELNLQQMCETYRIDIENLVAKAKAEFSS